MSTNRKREFPEHRQPNPLDGLARWLLGAVGLIWLGSIAVRAFRPNRLSPACAEPSSQRPEANRFDNVSVLPAKPLPRPSRGHETRDANAKWIFGVVVLLFVLGLGIHGVLAWFQHWLQQRPAPTDAWRPVAGSLQAAPARAPFPVLQVSPPQELQAFRAREEAELRSYGWINHTAGVVRIPIERAMDLVLQEGLATRSGTNGQQAGPSSYELIRQRPEHRQPEIQGPR